MRTRMVAARGLATLAGAVAVVLSLFSGVARGDEDSLKIRWDILPARAQTGPRALDGVTLEDFAQSGLASLTCCGLRTLENQIGPAG